MEGESYPRLREHLGTNLLHDQTNSSSECASRETNMPHIDFAGGSELPLSSAEKKSEVKKPTKHHVQRCAAFNCNNNRFDSPHLSFFRFPRDKERCKRWVLNCRRKDMMSKSAQELFNAAVLCSHHFEASQFTSALKNRLKPMAAIPTIFNIPKPLQKKTQSESMPAPGLEVEANALNDADNVCTNANESDDQLDSDDGQSAPCSPSGPAPNTELTDDSKCNDQLVCGDDGQIDLSAEQTVKDDLKRKMIIERLRNKRLEIKLLKKEEAQRLVIIKKELRKHLPKNCYGFVCKQLDMTLLTKGKKWTSASDIRFVLSLFHSSPFVYRFFHKLFNLPPISILGGILKTTQMYPGFPTPLMEAFRCKTKHMDENSKICVLTFHEMALRKSCIRDSSIEGLEFSGGTMENDEEYSSVSHATVFMARGLIGQWKQPFGYVLTSATIKHGDLKSFMFMAIEKLQQLGLTVKAVVCHHAPSNQTVFKSLGITAEVPYFCYKGDKIFLVFDPAHLIKDIRNCLIEHNFYTDEGVAQWQVITDFYEKDLQYERFRFADGLTRSHVHLSSLDRQQVSMALQTINYSVFRGISILCQFDVLPQSALPTATFCKIFDQLFNVFNASLRKSEALYRHPITKTSSHIDFLKTTAQWLKGLKYGSARRPRFARSLPYVCGWIHNINALLSLVDEIVDVQPGVEHLVTNGLNLDAVENVFDIVRLRDKGGLGNNPDDRQFSFRLRQVMVNNVLVASPSRNSKYDIDTFLFNMTPQAQTKTHETIHLAQPNV